MLIYLIKLPLNIDSNNELIMRQIGQPSSRCSLPPHSEHKPVLGHLRVSVLDCFFFNSKKEISIRFKMWGQDDSTYISKGAPAVFFIHTCNRLFKEYIIGSKMLLLEIVDHRNYVLIGTCYLNWLLYLRKLDDDSLTTIEGSRYHLPFFDCDNQISLSVYDAKVSGGSTGKLIGELTIQVSCRIGGEPRQINIEKALKVVSRKYQSSKASQQPSGKKNTTSKRKPELDEPNNNEKMQKSNVIDNVDLEDLEFKLHDNYGEKVSGKHPKEATINAEFSNDNKIVIAQNQKLQIELTRLRLQAEECLRKNGLEKTPIIDAQQELLIEVLSVLLRGKSKAKDCATIDVYLTKDSQSKHCTIYRVEVVGPINYFRSKLVVQRDETLVVVYAEKTNNKLKGTLRINEFAKEVGENGLQEIYLINEKGVVGGSVKIALKQKQTSVKVNVQQPQKPAIGLVNSDKKSVSVQHQVAQVSQHKEVNNKADSELRYVIISVVNMSSSDPQSCLFRLNSFIWPIQIDSPLSYFLLEERKLLAQLETCGLEAVLSSQKGKQVLHRESLSIDFANLVVSVCNLTCMTVYAKIWQVSVRQRTVTLKVSFFLGNMTQVNHLLASLRSQVMELPKKVLKSQGRQLSVPDDDSRQIRNLKTQGPQANKKHQQNRMKTEEHKKHQSPQKSRSKPDTIPKRETLIGNQDVDAGFVPNSQLSESEAEDEDSVYLVEIFSRFLHSLHLDAMHSYLQGKYPTLNSEDVGISFQQFAELYRSFVVDEEEKESVRGYPKELIEVIATMFMDPKGEDVQQQSVKSIRLGMFIGCCKAFDSFLKLYLAEKEEALRELILVEPDCVRLIKEHSELGVMSGSILWDRALQKVTNIELQSKIQRIYHIFQNMPVSIQTIVNDLVQFKEKGCLRIGTELSPTTIADLGRLIKQTTENYLCRQSRSDIAKLIQFIIEESRREMEDMDQMSEVNSEMMKHIVNLRMFRQYMGKVQLRMTIWEILLLIEQLKGWYACDRELDEGIIGSDTIIQWLKGLSRRIVEPELPKKSLRYEKSLPSVPDLNFEPLRRQPIGTNIEIPKANPSPKHSPSSRGQDKFKGNDSQIINIANLLRERDRNPYPQESQYQAQGERVEESILPASLKGRDDHQHYKLESKANIVADLSEVSFKIVTGCLHFVLKDVKIKLPNYPDGTTLKMSLKLSDDAQARKSACETSNLPASYMFFKPIQVQNLANRSLCLLYNQNAIDKLETESKGVNVVVEERKRGNIFCRGVLPLQDLLPLMRDKDLNNGKGLRKTVVLYDLKRQIVGKALFNIGLDFPTSLEHNNAPTLINLRIDQVKSMVSANSHIDLSLRDNLFEAKNYLIEHLQLLQSYKVSIVQPLYLTKLVLQNQQQMYALTIPLQELYFEHRLQGEYPLIDLIDGSCVAMLIIKLWLETEEQCDVVTNEKFLSNSKKQANGGDNNSQMEQKDTLRIQLYLDRICWLDLTSQSGKTLSGKFHIVFVQKPGSRESHTCFRSHEICLERKPDLARIELEKQHCTVDSQVVMVKLVQGQKVVANSDPINFGQSGNGLGRYSVMLRNEQGLLLIVRCRVIKCSNSVSKERVLDCLSLQRMNKLLNLQKNEIDEQYGRIKAETKLTMAEMGLLKQIVLDNMEQGQIIRIVSEAGVWQGAEVEQGHLTQKMCNFCTSLGKKLFQKFVSYEVQFAHQATGELPMQTIIIVTQALLKQELSKLSKLSYDVSQCQTVANRFLIVLQSFTIDSRSAKYSKISYLSLLEWILGPLCEQTCEVSQAYKQIYRFYDEVQEKYSSKLARTRQTAE